MATTNENTYIDPSINPDDKNLLVSLSERYTAMLLEYHKKYKKNTAT